MPRYLKWDKGGKSFVPDKPGKAGDAAPTPLQDAGEVPPPHARKAKVSSPRGRKPAVVQE